MSICGSGGEHREGEGIPAFVVLHDSALEDLCLVEPSNFEELRRVSGFGEKKVEMYGKEILDVLRRFRQANALPTKAN